MEELKRLAPIDSGPHIYRNARNNACSMKSSLDSQRSGLRAASVWATGSV